jgi:predicted secreted protein
MTVSAAIVLFAVIWFMTLFIVLPIRMKSQSEDGNVVAGTPASAPADANFKRKVMWTSIIAVILWIPSVYVISTGMISLDSLDYGGITPKYTQ